MKATLLDTLTGKITVAGYNLGSWNWAEGNWACDCNRHKDFGVDGDDTGYCLGGKRFLVIKAEFDKGEEEYTLEELNDDYPQELLDEFLPKEKG